MKISPRLLLLLLATLASTGLAPAQATQSPQAPAPTQVPLNPPETNSTSPKTKPARRTPATQTIPIESAAPTTPAPQTAAQQSAQKAADQKLLQQQEAQSEHAAQVNNQIVDKAQQQQDRAQSQTRVEDAPGPSQTGIVPAAGAPVAPAQSDVRVQDAPGPAQTLPSITSVTPSQLPATPTIPQGTQPPPQ